jgi:hypothetical protein
MFTVKETRDAGVFKKAQERGQLTFTIFQQDLSGAKTICEWIRLNIETAPADKLRDALETAIAYRDFPKRKVAD